VRRPQAGHRIAAPTPETGLSGPLKSSKWLVLVIGSSTSHYRIVEKLGEGGMGVIYKAKDTTLEPTVALKFLAAHLLDDEEAKERFLREDKAVAALQHPNICTVHEIGDVDRQPFMAMAFIEAPQVFVGHFVYEPCDIRPAGPARPRPRHPSTGSRDRCACR
jgi:serine/threonine protein kinase